MHRKDLSWLREDEPRVQERKQVKDQQFCISFFIVYPTISSSNQKHQSRHDDSIRCMAVWQIYRDTEQPHDLIRYDVATLFSVGKSNYNLGFRNQQLLHYMSVYITLTADQNQLKPGGKYICIYIYKDITINRNHQYNKHLINFQGIFSRPQATQLQVTPFQLLIIFLKASKFLANFMQCGRDFHILSLKLLRLLVTTSNLISYRNT